jgi:hypothetical protein
MDTVSSMNLAALSAITSNPEAVVAQYKGMRQPKLYLEQQSLYRALSYG